MPLDFSGYGIIFQAKSNFTALGAIQLLSAYQNHLYFRSTNNTGGWLEWKKII